MINIQNVTIIIIISTTGIITYVVNMCCRRMLNGDDHESITNRINEINSFNNSDNDSEYE